jgi:25S rRNA (cytosine2870-C5)-methyltransferase
MGPGRRMKKQGPPATLEELGIDVKKRKKQAQNGPPKKKRRMSDDDEVPELQEASPKKLVKQDRAARQEREINERKRIEKKRKQKLVNEDAQITIPPPMVEDDEEPEAEEIELDEAGFLDDDDEEADEIDLKKLAEEDSGSEQSVFDSDQDTGPQRMFSEDEDESDAEAKLTAANIEGLSRKLDQEQMEVDADAQQELEEAAIQTNIAADSELLDTAHADAGLAPDLHLIRSRMTETIRILGNFSSLAEPGKSRSAYTDQLIRDICLYYGYNEFLANKLFALFSPSEAFAFFEANETPRPVVLRTNTLRTNRRSLATALINRGVRLQPVGKWSKVGLQVFETSVPLGATPEYLAGHYILQAASSFLPVMALAPQPGERILDMAAAPGGKTTYISALMRNTGAVFANDANRKRAKGLIGNTHRMGVKNTIVCNYEAQKAFPKILGGFDRILLDAPCSGTGVIGKDPSVKTSKNERDFQLLPHMQKQLLLSAIDSVDHNSKTGGYIVYSTCSVTVEENEQVVQYALRKRPNVRIVDTGIQEGFGTEAFRSFEGKQFDENMNKARRWYPHKENVDGFFVCKFKKFGPLPSGVKTNGVSEVPEKVNGVDSKQTELKVSAGDDQPMDDDFGGFDDEEDKEYLARAERKWLRKKGLDPRIAGRKAMAAKEGGKVPKEQKQNGTIDSKSKSKATKKGNLKAAS